MCASTDLLKEYAKLHTIPHMGVRWLPRALAHAARYFYCPGNSQPRQLQSAKEAFLEVKVTIQQGNTAPEWLQNAVHCAKREVKKTKGCL